MYLVMCNFASNANGPFFSFRRNLTNRNRRDAVYIVFDTRYIDNNKRLVCQKYCIDHKMNPVYSSIFFTFSFLIAFVLSRKGEF
jgi:hypothetical protein